MVRKVVSRMYGLRSFQAGISISSSGGGFTRGTLSYQSGKFHLALSDGRVIASNKKALIVYNPSTRVAGKQDMYSGSGGLGWLSGRFCRCGGGSSVGAGAGVSAASCTTGVSPPPQPTNKMSRISVPRNVMERLSFFIFLTP